MHPPQLENGLTSGLPPFVKGFAERSGIKVDITGVEEIGQLPREVETALFRIIQEGLTNVHRHSGSPTVRIELTRENEQVCLRVADDGRGLPSGLICDNLSSGRVGVGLPGMRERVRQLGGCMEIHSSPSGVKLEVRLPLSKTRRAAG
jgi:signal transduction histidine kinase